MRREVRRAQTYPRRVPFSSTVMSTPPQESETVAMELQTEHEEQVVDEGGVQEMQTEPSAANATNLGPTTTRATWLA